MIHKDIKLENFFVDKNGRVKLGDFGFTHKIGNTVSSDFEATPRYAPPELAHAYKYHLPYADVVTQKGDIWSMGYMLYAVVGISKTQPFPYPDKYSNHLQSFIQSLSEISQQQDLPDFPEPSCKESIQYLIWRMLRPQKEDRPTSKELLEIFEAHYEKESFWGES